jgi:hypothetical protein
MFADIDLDVPLEFRKERVRNGMIGWINTCGVMER